MLLAPRETGLDLPVYGAGTPVVASGELRSLRKPENPWHEHDRVLRLVKANLDLEATQLAPPDSLVDFLDNNDDELAEVAEVCDANLIDYEWGLLHDPDGLYEDYYPRAPLDSLVPDNHVLVAEVEVVKNAFTLYTSLIKTEYPETYSKLRENIDQYESKASGWILTDIWVPQFVGSDDGSGGLDITLVDIDPKIEFVD